MTTEQLIERLQEIQQFTLLALHKAKRGLIGSAKVVSKQTLAQRSLADSLGLDRQL